MTNNYLTKQRIAACPMTRNRFNHELNSKLNEKQNTLTTQIENTQPPNII